VAEAQPQQDTLSVREGSAQDGSGGLPGYCVCPGL